MAPADFRAVDAQPAAVFGAREAGAGAGAEVPAPVVDTSVQSAASAVPIAAPSIGHAAECYDDDDGGARSTAADGGGDSGGGPDDEGGGGMATPMHTDD